MSTVRRPLTNAEQAYRTTYIDLCSLYSDRKYDEAEKLAWQFYQYLNIPLILRIMCCIVLGKAMISPTAPRQNSERILKSQTVKPDSIFDIHTQPNQETCRNQPLFRESQL
ncbi:hypothetical protein ST47_g9178 [Ascochyta rabiei]|uniref:Uncharacterized protein n=1 Tax=Didymella rabiei TaxID=5454 RepID=A0A162XJT0_DIDRA|nr:hypothetical protein ST47_g9178 [Ascochyta rabiei]